MNVGMSIKIALAKRGMTQVQLATKVQRSTVWINKLACSNSADGKTINMLAKALGMKSSEFIALGEDDS